MQLTGASCPPWDREDDDYAALAVYSDCGLLPTMGPGGGWLRCPCCILWLRPPTHHGTGRTMITLPLLYTLTAASYPPWDRRTMITLPLLYTLYTLYFVIEASVAVLFVVRLKPVGPRFDPEQADFVYRTVRWRISYLGSWCEENTTNTLGDRRETQRQRVR